MKVIFLDFDGVLATDDYSDYLLRNHLSDHDCFGTKFNPECIRNLKQIIDASGAKIVITSSWRLSMSILKIRLMWYYRKLPGEIVGYTPRVHEDRGLEIEKWLSRRKDITHYIILDDMNYLQFEVHQEPHLITCNHFKGLQKEDVQKALDALETTVGSLLG